MGAGRCADAVAGRTVLVTDAQLLAFEGLLSWQLFECGADVGRIWRIQCSIGATQQYNKCNMEDITFLDEAETIAFLRAP